MRRKSGIYTINIIGEDCMGLGLLMVVIGIS